MAEYRMFAAVIKTTGGRDYMNPHTVRPLALQVRKYMSGEYKMTWEQIKRQGWRIRPVIIRLEEQEQ